MPRHRSRPATTSGATAGRRASRSASSSGAAPRVRATPTSARRSAPGLNPPLNANNIAQAALIAWAAERGIAADYTEDLSQFRLNNYQAVVFLSSNRDTLDDSAQTTLMQYIRGGGGFVGIHNAFGAEYHWPYYEGLLGGANFYNHGPNRDGTVETINGNDVSTSFMPETWAFKDEWYNLIPYPSFVNVLLEVDQATSEATLGRPRRIAPGELVPVLRRRPGVADDARSRRGGLDRRSAGGRRVLQAARDGGPRERDGHQAVLRGLTPHREDRRVLSRGGLNPVTPDVQAPSSAP